MSLFINILLIGHFEDIILEKNLALVELAYYKRLFIPLY
jgi:hypothetical protein